MLEDLEREVDILRNDFQSLEKIFHNLREVLEAKIESLTEEVKNATRKES